MQTHRTQISKTPKEVAEELGCVLVGDGKVSLSGIRDLRSAGRNDLSIFTNHKYLEDFLHSKASVFIVSEKAYARIPQSLEGEPRTYIIAKGVPVETAIAKSIDIFYPKDDACRKTPLSYIQGR